MNAFGKSIILLSALISLCAAQERRNSAGAVLGNNFYWQNPESKHDTIAWLQVASQFKSGLDSVKVYKLKNPSAISIFILKEMNFDLFALSRWQCITRTGFKVRAPDFGDRYSKQGIMTDVMWESVDGVERENQARSGKPFVKMFFRGGGWVQTEDWENPSASARQIFGTAGLVVFYGNSSTPLPDGAQAETIYRSIFSIYVAVPADKTPKQIEKEIEDKMDEMKLDLSCKPPVLVEAAGPWSVKGDQKK